MASQYPPKKNTAFTLFFTLYKNDGTVIANPGTYTKKVSIDGAAVADIAASVTEEDTTYGQLSVVLANTEMNGDAIWIYIKDDTTGCVPFTCSLYTVANTQDEIGTDVAAVHTHVGAIDTTVNHADYGNAKLVRSTTPANTLTVDAAHNVGIIRPSGTIVDDAGNSTTVFKTNLTSAEDDYIVDAYIKFTSGANINQVKKVSAYNGTSKVITTAAFTDEPAENDTFVIINE